jgi:Tfp pilus assembly protein PilV
MVAKKRGVTLIDAMISIIVLSMGFLSILQVIPGTGIFIKSSQNRLMAQQIAQSYVELYSTANIALWPDITGKLNSGSTGFPKTQTVTTNVNRIVSSTNFQVNVSTSPFTVATTGKMYNLNVKVTWNEHTMGRGTATGGGRLRQIELVTIVVNPGNSAK